MSGKKSLFLVLCGMLAALCCPVFALEGTLLLSPATNVHDQFRCFSSGRTPRIPTVRQALPGQTLYLYLLLRDPAGEVSGDLEVVKPDGSRQQLCRGARFFPGPGGKGVFLASSALKATLSEKDPKGEYEYRITLHEKGRQKPVSASCRCRFAAPAPDRRPMDEKEFRLFFEKYYLFPRPERAPAAFLYFAGHDEAWRRDGKKEYTPGSVLAALALILQRNPQLHEEFLRCSEKLSDQGRRYLGVIFAAAGPETLKAVSPRLDPYIREYLQTTFKGKNPLAFSEITRPGQLDALWNVFFITGELAHLQPLIGALRRQEEIFPQTARTMAEITGGQLPPQERKKLMNYLIRTGAEVRLAQYCRRHETVCEYLGYLTGSGLIGDDEISRTVKAILRGAEEERRKQKQDAE